jgi:integrase
MGQDKHKTTERRGKTNKLIMAKKRTIDVYSEVYKLDFSKVFVKLDAAADILPADKKAIKQFHDWLLLHNQKPQTAIQSVRFLMKRASGQKKPFREYDKEDIREWIYSFQSSGLKTGTICNYVAWLKHLFVFLLTPDIHGEITKLRQEELPTEVAWIPRLKRERSRIRPEDLLSPAEFLQLIKKVKNPQHKAMFYVLYECGLRIGECLSLTIRNVYTDADGLTIDVPNTGKTGARPVVLSESAPALTAWLNLHPDREDPNASLWLNRWGRIMSYSALYKTLHKYLEAAGIEKHVNPHLFRHCAISNLADKEVSTLAMNDYFGWAGNSMMMFSHYGHITKRQSNRAILRARGKTVPDDVGSVNILKAIKCFNCGHENPPDVKFCERCNQNPRDAVTADEIRKRNAMSLLMDMLGLDDSQMEKMAAMVASVDKKKRDELARTHGIKLKRDEE